MSQKISESGVFGQIHLQAVLGRFFRSFEWHKGIFFWLSKAPRDSEKMNKGAVASCSCTKGGLVQDPPEWRHGIPQRVSAGPKCVRKAWADVR